mgnify:CR=1 FL=1
MADPSGNNPATGGLFGDQAPHETLAEAAADMIGAAEPVDTPGDLKRILD